MQLPGSTTQAGILIMLGWHPPGGAEKQETGLGAVLQIPPRSLWKCFILEDTRWTVAFVPRLLPGVNQVTRVALLQLKTWCVQDIMISPRLVWFWCMGKMERYIGSGGLWHWGIWLWWCLWDVMAVLDLVAGEIPWYKVTETSREE